MKKEKKVLLLKLILIIVNFLIITFLVLNTNTVMADDKYQGIGPGEGSGSILEVSNKVVTVIGIMQAVGILLSIVMIMILGINYFTASHTPEGKAKADQRMQSIILGTILIGSATLIISTIAAVIKEKKFL